MNHDMRAVSLEKLAPELIRSEKELWPLCYFKGTNPKAVRKYYNFAYAMFLAQAPTIKAGMTLAKDGEISHICGFHRNLSRGPVMQIFQRLRGTPEVTRRIVGFTEYVEWVEPAPCVLQRVSPVSYDGRHRIAYWRTVGKPSPKLWSQPQAPQCYPFCREHSDDGLLTRVHSMIPKGIHSEIRGDLCQDMLVAVLSGDLSVENIPDAIGKYLRAARKFLPANSRLLSLDAPLFNDTDRTMHDTVSA